MDADAASLTVRRRLQSLRPEHSKMVMRLLRKWCSNEGFVKLALSPDMYFNSVVRMVLDKLGLPLSAPPPIATPASPTFIPLYAPPISPSRPSKSGVGSDIPSARPSGPFSSAAVGGPWNARSLLRPIMTVLPPELDDGEDPEDKNPSFINVGVSTAGHGGLDFPPLGSASSLPRKRKRHQATEHHQAIEIQKQHAGTPSEGSTNQDKNLNPASKEVVLPKWLDHSFPHSFFLSPTQAASSCTEDAFSTALPENLLQTPPSSNVSGGGAKGM